MLVRAAAAVLVVLLVVVGCSGDDGETEVGDDVDDEAGVEAAAGADDDSDPDEGAAAATGTSDDEDAEAGTEDDEPTTTMTDSGSVGLGGSELEAYVAERYEAYWDAYDAARAAPTVDPASDFPNLAELAAGDQLAISHEALVELAEKGEAIREPDTPAIAGIDADTEHRVRVVLVDDSVAELSTCVVNDDVRHIVGTGAVVRDEVTTVTSEATMALTDGDWKLIRSRAVDISEGVTGCWLEPDAEYPH